jgi:hypothetical protein
MESDLHCMQRRSPACISRIKVASKLTPIYIELPPLPRRLSQGPLYEYSFSIG